jgi:ABC-type sugar transport system ATPase subunit
MSIHLQNVSVAIGGEKIIDNVDVALQRGTMNVLLGATLAGKTSLMRLMAGLDQPTSGKILVDGADVTGVPVRKRSVAMVYQQFVNYPSLSVYENIASPLRVAKVKADEVERRVHEAAKVLGLEPFLKRQPSQLSGGQQQSAPIWCCWTSRSPISITSCARNCAKSCRVSCRRRARHSFMQRPSRLKRSSLAATPQRSGKAVSFNSGRHPKSITGPATSSPRASFPIRP